MGKKYVAYVGTYTHGTSKGIQVYDVNLEEGTLTERSEVEVSNASYTAVSKNGKYLYSIEDEGVAVFKRDHNGDLSRINAVDTGQITVVICPVSTALISTACADASWQQT